jgi:acetolactate synthase-1/2/3 large subunit
MSEKVTAGEVVAAFLEAAGVECTFGVISIHNMPMLDAIGRRNRIRYVCSRGEAGAVNMADAYARVKGSLGVAFTSTGTGSGNAAGAMVEALTAGSPVLHLTGQIELPWLDKNWSYIHEARDQLSTLKSVSKAAYRVWSTDTLLGTLREAVRVALTPPMGPVSIEIPIDVQEAKMDMPADLAPLPLPAPVADTAAIDALAEALLKAKRPLIWAGGGARHAGAQIRRLADMGFGIVTSVQGRGVLPEDDARSLGAFNLSPTVEAFYGTCDALLVVGSRLRGNETLKWQLKLPQPMYQIDADPQAQGRGYKASQFVCGDAADVLGKLADRLAGKVKIDAKLHADLKATHHTAFADMQKANGPYAGLLTALRAAMPRDAVWVRDVTVSNSTWGNRGLALYASRDGVHALGGGIGQGLQMGIGAALGAEGRRTVALCGDGGLMLNIGELATAVQEQANLLLLVMNDKGYGVIRNIQDARFGGRKYFVDLHTPSFAKLADTFGWTFKRIDSTDKFAPVLAEAMKIPGPVMVEVDMIAIGPYAQAFAGPPLRKS